MLEYQKNQYDKNKQIYPKNEKAPELFGIKYKKP